MSAEPPIEHPHESPAAGVSAPSGPAGGAEGSRSALVLKYFDVASKVFAVGAAVVYATGFVVVTSFFERFGIHEEGDFLKARYVHVGLLSVLFPLLILTPLLLFFYLRQKSKDTHKWAPAGIIFVFHIFFVCYWFVIYSPVGSFHRKSMSISGMFLWTFIIFTSVRRLAIGIRKARFLWWNFWPPVMWIRCSSALI